MEKDGEGGGKGRVSSFSDLSTGQIRKILAEETKSNKQIDKEMKNHAEEMRKEVTLLLLGAGEAGKSTILKQLRILHDSGFSASERDTYVRIVRRNVVTGLKEVCQHGIKAGYSFGSHKSLAEEFAEIDDKIEFSSVVSDVKLLIGTDGVKKVLSKVGEFQIPDSTPVFLKDLDRIAAADYKPTDNDVVLSRVMTTSIVEYKFVVANTPFRIVDVAGQRSQRKKWFHFFDNVTAMIFVASLSNYNLPLREAPEQNAMTEQIQLFGEMINGPWFKNTAVLLFLNKRDLFEAKVETVPLTECFPDYVYGDPDHPEEKPSESKFEHGLNYIRMQFLAQNQRADKIIYPHATCATDTNNVAALFQAVRDIIMRSQLAQ